MTVKGLENKTEAQMGSVLRGAADDIGNDNKMNVMVSVSKGYSAAELEAGAEGVAGAVKSGASSVEIADAIKGVVDSGLDSAGVASALQSGQTENLKKMVGVGVYVIFGASIMERIFDPSSSYYVNGFADMFFKEAVIRGACKDLSDCKFASQYKNLEVVAAGSIRKDTSGKLFETVAGGTTSGTTLAADVGVTWIPYDFRARNGIVLVVEASPGRTLDGHQARWDLIKKQYIGRTNVLVSFHGIGGDVTLNRPWSGMSDSAKLVLKAAYDKLVDDIESNGNRLLIIGTSFRNYDGTTVDNPQNGSLPFDDEIVKPAMMRNRWSWANNRPRVTLYPLAYKYPDILESDTIHPNNGSGEPLYRAVVFGGIFDVVLGVETVNAEDLQLSPVRSIVGFGSDADGVARESYRSKGVIRVPNVVGYGKVRATSMASNVVNSIFVESLYDNALIASTGSSAIIDGVTEEAGLYCSDIRLPLLSTAVYDSYVPAVKITGGTPLGSVTLGIRSHRTRTSAETTRVGRFSLDAGLTYVEIDASSFNQDLNGTLSVCYIKGAFDMNGEIILSMKGNVSGSNAYLCGIDVRPE